MSPQKSRAKIQSLSVGSQWLSTVFDTIAFYPLYYLIGSYSILVIFVIPCSLITGFLAYYMPETRDLTIDASEDRASLITPPPATTEDRSIFDPSEAGEEPRSLTE